jgi:hypothetical protein
MRRVTDEQMLDRIRDRAESEIKSAGRYLEDFRVKFEKDPARAFEWSSDSFKQAARDSVAKTVLAYLERFRADDIYSLKTPQAQLEIILKEFAAETMRNAKWPEHSTSPTSNYMSLCMMSARAEWVEHLEEAIIHVGSEYKHYLDLEEKNV